MHHRATPLFIFAVILCVSAIAGCGKKKRHASRPIAMPVGSVETGLASWYGYPYHGRAAADGEIYDMEKLTAAHRTLPFGTWVRVTNVSNGKNVELRIIDRGPFIAGRIVDVSHAGAQAIGLIGPGVAQVRMEVIATPAVQAIASLYAVQVGAFQDRERAVRMRDTLLQQYGAARVVFRDGKPPLWRVLVGAEPSLDAANVLAQRLLTEVGSGFVVRLDEPEAPPAIPATP